MKRTITVKGREGRLDEPSFLLTENEDLTLVFAFPDEIRTGRYIAVVRHGDAAKASFTLGADKSVKLSAEWLKKGGTENVEISLCYTNQAGTVVIKDDFLIEPLKVETVGGNFAFTPIITQLQSELAELKSLYLEELEAKRALLEKLKDYVDNGAELAVDEIN
jgi:hypothetical protein